MQAKIKTLTANNGSNEEYIVYPRTLIKCVTNENGDSLETTLKEFIADNVDEVITEVVEEAFDTVITEDIDPVYAKTTDVNSTVSNLQTQINKKVPNTLTVNNKALVDNITLNAEDVGADPAGSASDALAAAKEYTDEEVTKANTYADGVGATTLASAKAYSDTNASTTLTSAKDYAAEEDAKTLATAKSHADTKATNTLTTAKTYSDSNAASALASAKSYTDTSAANTLASAKEYNDAAYANANAYTDQKIAELINGAPGTLDTLKEIADAMSENESLVNTLEEAIGTKAEQAELDGHTGNTTIHITADERTNWNDANSKKHIHSNKAVLDNTTASYTAEEKTKLAGVASGAEVNQNAFSNIVVGTTTISADSKTDSVTLVAGENITIIADNATDKITITAKDTVYEPPTSYPASMITGLSTVATSGKYSDLSGKPTIPTKTSELTNDSGFKTTDNNTTYTLTKSGSTITLTGSDGKTTSVIDNDTNTTYSVATQSAQGLMSAADKKKLDSVASGANAYSLPTASSSTLGGVKTTSTVTSTSGYTACPIISGVPYYKDTNTTYNLGSFGITATAAELNYCDGVTSNIQTQLNSKVVKRLSTGTSYIQLGDYYNSGNTAAYIKISFPSIPSWTMMSMELTVRQNYNAAQYGKIHIYANQSTAADWNQFYAVTYDRLTTDIKVYGSDKQHIYIGGIAAWGGLSVDRLLIGDSATASDLSNITITGVSALPTTYQTAIMYYNIHSGNISSQSVNYATSAGTANTVAWANVSGKPSSMPASDVYSWAKASSKPSYTYSEVGAAAASHGHTSLTGIYTGNGGSQPPSYVGVNAVKCNMMRQFTGTSISFSHYADVLMMNAYTWSDVPYATALAIQKTNGVPRAWIAAGGNTDKWAGATELITANNIGNQSVSSATTATKLGTDAGSATQPVYFSGGKPVACTYTLGKSVPSNAVFTDTNTHYTTRIYAGASGTAANTAATSPYIKITDDNTYRNQIRLIGGGATTVTSDANGNITITSTDTNTNTTYSAGTGLSLSSTTFSVKYGTAAGTACQGNDSRLSDSRTPKSHNQAASTITAGTFGGQVVAPASTAYTTNHVRNGVFTTTDPGAGASSSHANGSIIYVYE